MTHANIDQWMEETAWVDAYRWTPDLPDEDLGQHPMYATVELLSGRTIAHYADATRAVQFVDPGGDLWEPRTPADDFYPSEPGPPPLLVWGAVAAAVCWPVVAVARRLGWAYRPRHTR